MNSLLKIGAVAAVAMVAASQSQAQTYASVGAGVFLPEKQDVTVGTANGSAKFGTGTSFQGALGYDFGTGLRTELEFGFNDSDLKTFRTTTASTRIAGGDVDQLTLHAAGYYDFAVGGFAPYIGAGLGLTRTDYDAASVGAVNLTGGRDTDFSAFGEAGVSIPVTERLSIAPGVRYSWVDMNGSDFTAWTFKTALRFAF
ncbi:MAG: outer membrane protein [Rhodospirillaceae bacterium]